MAKESKAQVEKRTYIKSKIPDFKGWLNEMYSENDRATAVLGAAYLDACLEEILIAFMIDDKDSQENLLGIDRSISTFNARFNLSYCLGLLSEIEKKDCKIIAQIRNKFGHQLHKRSFKDDDIKVLCNELQTLKPFNPGIKNIKLECNEREQFIKTIGIIALTINTRKRKIKHRKVQLESNCHPI